MLRGMRREMWVFCGRCLWGKVQVYGEGLMSAAVVLSSSGGSLVRINDSIWSQTRGSFSISICGPMKRRAYQGYLSQATWVSL